MGPGQITPNIECVVLLLKAGLDSFDGSCTQLGVIDSNDFENNNSYGDVYEDEMTMMMMMVRLMLSADLCAEGSLTGVRKHYHSLSYSWKLCK